MFKNWELLCAYILSILYRMSPQGEDRQGDGGGDPVHLAVGAALAAALASSQGDDSKKKEVFLSRYREDWM